MSRYSSLNHYKQNILTSQKYYAPLSVLEIALRNAIDQVFSQIYGRDWLLSNQILKFKQSQKINDAKVLLENRNEQITHDKLVAELNFGFWTSLFSKPYDKQLRATTLVKIFNNLPPKNKFRVSREVISKDLNAIRKFRNRVFHHEKIIDSEKLKEVTDQIGRILIFLDQDLFEFVVEIMDRDFSFNTQS